MPAGRRFGLRCEARQHRAVVVAGAHVVAAMSETSASAVPQGHDAANILLVDDQPARLLTYRAVLEPLGHNLVAVKSGLEALEAMRKQVFAVGLLDLNM